MSIVQKELEVLGEVRTFGELQEVLQDLQIALDSLNIFSAVSITAVEPPQVHKTALSKGLPSSQNSLPTPLHQNVCSHTFEATLISCV